MDLTPPDLLTGLLSPASATPAAPSISDSDSAMRAVATRFETAFLAEMLMHAGIGEMREGFNGGAGEAAFSGLLTWEYAEEIADRGTFGVADKVYAALKERVEQ